MSAARPVPVLRGEEKVYFAEAKAGRLVFQRCGGCADAIFYPRSVCPNCLSEQLSYEASAGRGTIYSFTTLHRAGHPGLADEVPYTVVLVDLDEGVRVLANIVECEPDEVTVGATVEVLFDPVSEDLTVPRFRLAGGAVAR